MTTIFVSKYLIQQLCFVIDLVSSHDKKMKLDLQK